MDTFLDDLPEDKITSDTVSWSSTEILVFRRKYEWHVNNFRILPTNDGLDPVDSSPFDVGPEDEYKFRMRLYPIGLPKSTNTHVGVFLAMLSNDTFDSVLVRFRISLFTMKGSVLKSAEKEVFFCEESSDGWSHFIERDLLRVDGEFLHELLIRCDVTVPADSQKCCSFSARNDGGGDLRSSLATDLKFVLENGTASDLVLSVPGCEIKVHKAILIARCPYFASVLYNDNEDTKRDRLELMEFSKEAIEFTLKFIYTGSVGDFDFPLAKELLAACYKFDLSRLCVICENFLMTNFTDQNVSELLALADKCKALNLKENAISYIMRNMPQVRITDGWFTHLDDRSDLINDIIKHMGRGY